MLLKGVILCFKSTYFILSTYKGSHFGIYMLPFCGVPSMFGLRTRDHLQWVQIASDERHMGLTSTSDEHQTGFKSVQMMVSYNAAWSPRIALRVFRVELAIVDPFTWLGWTPHGLGKDFRWASRAYWAFRIGLRNKIPLAADELRRLLRCASDNSFRSSE